MGFDRILGGFVYIVKLYVWFRSSRSCGVLFLVSRLGLLAAVVVSRLRIFSFAFGVGRSRVCGGFVFVFSLSSASIDHAFQ